ncbi:energy transducer TonB [Dyadobacter frigoris]|nr:TonB family protein [Dyadobacter frigoris]
MKRLLLIFVLISYQAVSQTVYQPHEVEKQATPVGGFSILNQFIFANIQVPFSASVKGINSKIFVKGIVETDGSMTGLQVVKGIDSLCDQEAIRVLSLYKAWQPAVLKDVKVRQAAVYHVSFLAPKNENFDSGLAGIVHYYNDKFLPVTDSKDFKYRSVMPVNEQGFIKDDISYEALKGDKWKRMSTIPFERNEFWKIIYGEPGVDSVQAYELSAKDRSETNYAPKIAFQKNGKILLYREYSSAKKLLLKKDYYLSGMIKEVENFEDSISTKISWYRNGQIKSVIQNPPASFEVLQESRIVNAWEPDGTQNVKNGNGWWRYSGEENNKLLTEEGAVNVGSKIGKWVGKLPDSTIYYVEQYENGLLKEGTCVVNGENVSYKTKGFQPKFGDGMKSVYQFLGQNIKYPIDASRKGISGVVLLSFTVCEDGSLCDYKLEKSVVKDIDQEALRVVKKMDGKWKPGELRGQKVRVKYNLPINFMLF